MSYVTFLLDLNDTGSIRWLAESLKFRPSDDQPANAFAWKITCDSNGVVAVRALRDKQLVLIAHAKLATTGLIDRVQLGSEPTVHQWQKVEDALREAVAERTNEAGDDDFISEPIAPKDLGRMKSSMAQAMARVVRREAHREGGEAHRARRQDQGPWVVGGIVVMVVGAFVVYFATRPGATEPASVPAPVATPPAAPELPSRPGPPAPSPTPTTLADVIARTPDLDVAKLASYRVRWSDVDVASQTTLAKVEKDPSAEKGKRVCVEGTIERITKKELAGRPHYEGALITGEGDRVAFVVGGSTGELVKRDAAKLCGVVTGTIEGATAVFGMFDLPENRNPVVEKTL